jgi:REP element-mobilizing transposase RayT
MMSLFKEQYRVESSRLMPGKYAQVAWYFVTIDTDNDREFFGTVEDESVHLSESGEIAQRMWELIPEQFPFVELDEMVIMPNHVHGILHITEGIRIDRDAINRVYTNAGKILPGGVTGKNNPMLSNNLSRVIRWYKGRVTYELRRTGANFKWHSRFHDRILRISRNELEIRRKYIQDNPKNWNKAKETNLQLL